MRVQLLLVVVLPQSTARGQAINRKHIAAVVVFIAVAGIGSAVGVVVGYQL